MFFRIARQDFHPATDYKPTFTFPMQLLLNDLRLDFKHNQLSLKIAFSFSTSLSNQRDEYHKNPDVTLDDVVFPIQELIYNTSFLEYITEVRLFDQSVFTWQCLNTMCIKEFSLIQNTCCNLHRN